MPENHYSKLLQFRKLTFEAHCKILLSGLLDDWSKKTLMKKIPPKSSEKENTPLIIYIEDRIEYLKVLRFSILNSLIMCRLKMRVIVYTTNSKLSYLQSFFKDISAWVNILSLDEELIESINISSYNKLLKNSLFWSQIPSESILLMQIDALLIEPIEFSFFKYDYIGAPWTHEKNISTMFYTYSEDLLNEVYSHWETLVFNKGLSHEMKFGNGGLSIRNINKMKLICELESSSEDESEDKYFSRCLKKHNANLPTINEARRFSCETEYFHSFGSHNSHLYLRAEEQAKIYERHFINLMALLNASRKI